MKAFPFDPDDRATLARLRRMPVFDAMEPDLLPALLELAHLRRFEPGEVIIAEGAMDRLVYFLVHGRCAVNVDGMDLAAISRTGDVFGEMGMLDGKPRSATVTAVEPTLCLVLDNTFLARLKGVDRLAAQALFYRIFSEILAARIRAANARLLALDGELETLSLTRPTA